MSATKPLPPGSTIGILGGGQLGRMTALAAAQLGYRCIVYSPEEHSIGGDVAAGHVRGAYDDTAALARFAAEVDVILRDGRTLRLRPPVRADVPALTDFFRALSRQSLYNRFHGTLSVDERLADEEFPVFLGLRARKVVE